MELQRIKNLVVYYATLSNEPCNETIFSFECEDSAIRAAALDTLSIAQRVKLLEQYQ